MPAGKVTIEQCAQALHNSGGFLSIAAEQLKISPSALCQRIKKSKVLQKVIADIDENRLDLAESKLLKNMKQSEKPAVSQRAVEFYLRYKGRQRQYIETQRHLHEGGEEPIKLKVEVEEIEPPKPDKD
jgi:hypothetical protein